MPKPYSLICVSASSALSMKVISPRRRGAFQGVGFFVVNLVKALRARGALPASPAADAATPSSNHIGRFFWSRSPEQADITMPELAA